MGEIIQNSFASGELSPGLYGRTDLSKYHSGAALLRNFFVEFGGGASNRAGLQFIGRCLGNYGIRTRLIPFVFSSSQAYALEFGNYTMRVIMNGGYVLEPPNSITGISNSSPAVITASAHGYNNGDWIYVSGVSGMTNLNTLTCIVQNATTNTFTLTDLWGNVINSASWPAYISGGTVGRIYTLATPYAAADLPVIKYTQKANLMTLTHNSYGPYNLTRIQHWSWTLAAITYAPSQAAPTGLSASTVSSGSTTYQYQVTSVGANGITESQPSNTASSASATMSTTVCSQYLSWTAVPGAVEYNVYRTQEVAGGTPSAGMMFGFVGSCTGTSFEDQNITPDFTRTPPMAYNPFSGGNNPGCSTYFQGRQAFAGTVLQPDGIFLSKSGDFLNMDYSSPSRASDSIAYSLTSLQVNPIKHLVPMYSMIALTSFGAWKIDDGSVGAAVTPSSMMATPQAYNGCSDVIPLVVNYDILYVQSKGSKVRDLSYNYYVNLYTGTDISVMSNHLFYGHEITEWCWAEEPHKLVWACREDGQALTLTFLKEQEVMGWSHHDTQGLFMSVCSIPENGADAVYFVVARYINGQFVQYTERLSSRVPVTSGDVAQVFFVDAGITTPPNFPAATVTPSGTTGSITLTASAGVFSGTVGDVIRLNGGVMAETTGSITQTASAGVFSGTVGDVIRLNGGVMAVTQVISATQVQVLTQVDLDTTWPALSGQWSMLPLIQTIGGLQHLEGQTVSILADGNVMPQQVVTNGQITIQSPAALVTVGLPYTAQLQSLYVDVPETGGQTSQGRRKQIPSAIVRMENSRGVYVGHDFGKTLYQMKERTSQLYGQPVQLITGDENINLTGLYDVAAQVCVQQTDPLPCTILAIMPTVDVGN